MSLLQASNVNGVGPMQNSKTGYYCNFQFLVIVLKNLT